MGLLAKVGQGNNAAMKQVEAVCLQDGNVRREMLPGETAGEFLSMLFRGRFDHVKQVGSGGVAGDQFVQVFCLFF